MSSQLTIQESMLEADIWRIAGSRYDNLLRRTIYKKYGNYDRPISEYGELMKDVFTLVDEVLKE